MVYERNKDIPVAELEKTPTAAYESEGHEAKIQDNTVV